MNILAKRNPKVIIPRPITIKNLAIFARTLREDFSFSYYLLYFENKLKAISSIG
jgi:hypothetical protein